MNKVKKHGDEQVIRRLAIRYGEEGVFCPTAL
jgi:hypothetical protein